MARKSWIQVNGRLIPKEEYRGDEPVAPQIMPDIEPFVSPITGQVIRGRRDLRQHNKEHGVTNASDYSPEFIAKRATERVLRAAGQDKESRADRIRILKELTEGR